MSQYATGGCSVPRCDRPIRALGLCLQHYARFLRFGETFPDVPIGANTTGLRRRRAIEGPNYCTCVVSRPGDPANAGACAACGYPCIARMSERLRHQAFAKFPWAATQRIEPVDSDAFHTPEAPRGQYSPRESSLPTTKGQP